MEEIFQQPTSQLYRWSCFRLCRWVGFWPVLQFSKSVRYCHPPPGCHPSSQGRSLEEMSFQRDPRTGLIPADTSRPPRQVLRSEAHAPFLEDFERKENRGKANPGCRVWQGLPCVRLPLISMVSGPRDACIIAVCCVVQVFASGRLMVNSLWEKKGTTPLLQHSISRPAPSAGLPFFFLLT